LLTGPLEPTNQWYAVAKIAGIKLCQAYRRQTFRTGNHQSLIRQCGLDRDLAVTAGDPQMPPAGRAECE
jgi:NAD dependent epimerase/dehydratase family